jgi:hypothetical protein
MALKILIYASKDQYEYNMLKYMKRSSQFERLNIWVLCDNIDGKIKLLGNHEQQIIGVYTDRDKALAHFTKTSTIQGPFVLELDTTITAARSRPLTPIPIPCSHKPLWRQQNLDPIDGSPNINKSATIHNVKNLTSNV